ncbi:unnamed protein product [Sphagnum compactum]
MGCCASYPVGEKRIQKKKRKNSVEELRRAEAKNDALLPSVPGRMVTNGVGNAVVLHTQQGAKGINQDAVVVWEGFTAGGVQDDDNDDNDTVFCGVFDGHGPFGHLAAQRVRDSLPSKLIHYWHEQLAAVKSSKEEAATTTTQEKIPAAKTKQMVFEAWKKPHLAAYKTMDKELQLHPDIDCFCSGTTSVTLLKQGQHLVIGNLGDSRAVMGTKDENGNLVPVQLTIDLKPDVPQEADRIRQCKGRIYALKNEPHLRRVWLPHEEAPGLAMSRTFGDFCLKDYGIIAVPELSYRQLTDQDQFVVLATDGIWDVLSNEEVMELIASAPTRATAACTLVEGAIRVWQLKYPSARIDDCAVACIYLDDATVPISQNSKSKDEEAAVTVDTADNNSQAVSDATQLPKEEGANEEVRKMPLQSKLVNLSSSGDDNDHEEWLALEGITHANSLIDLPTLLLQPNKPES